MAYSKVILNGTTLMDATIATAAAADITAPKTAMLADGVMTTGTGSGGGGGSNWVLLASEEVEVSTTSTSAQEVATIQLNNTPVKDDIIWVHVRDKAGKRNGYYYGGDGTFLIDVDSTWPTVGNPPIYAIYYNSNNYAMSSNRYGIYPYTINQYGVLQINSRYSSTSTLTINGTYKIDVYKLDPASGMTMFD